MPIQPIIDVHNASKMFDRVTALDQVSCTVEAGEVVGLLGPNGSGKTTLLRLLCAYFPPTSGSVRVAGYDTRFASLEVHRRLGFSLVADWRGGGEKGVRGWRLGARAGKGKGIFTAVCT